MEFYSPNSPFFPCQCFPAYSTFMYVCMCVMKAAALMSHQCYNSPQVLYVSTVDVNHSTLVVVLTPMIIVYDIIISFKLDIMC